MYVLAVHSSKSWIHRSVSSQHDTALFYCDGWMWFYAFFLLASASVSKENSDIISSAVRKLLHATLLEIVMNSQRDVMNVATMPPTSFILCLHLLDGNSNVCMQKKKLYCFIKGQSPRILKTVTQYLPTCSTQKQVITFAHSQRNI